ncbi:MAG: 16S rRNA (guanine(527)-N(7))-methyltransferase RsmG [Acholeplasmatales bacterium]|jgi:16S rRNA (guanine527-N7)-methyltransferase|nr:16S rRNA (guanine(527)-N(7))-methyltransferase RsmG [Acholeplasmatales bacterium]
MNFKEELLKLNIELSDEASSRFDLYYKRLIAVNEVMNLTAITEEQEVYNKHFLDSLMIVKALDLNKEFTLCDVGSGAGFPSIPLSIISDNAKVTIIDALNKRIKFLNDLILELGLKNVIALHERAEDFAKTKREFFDVTTARAVARLNILSELCLPLTKVGGYFIAMKGQGGNEEIKEATKGIEILGGHVEKVISLELPDNAGARDIIIIKKIKETPKKYPRAFAKIKERPL